MKKKFVRRIAAMLASAVIGTGAVCMFAACTSDHPEVTITYTFNGKAYEVSYILSREDAPETVRHFIELADAGFYDGTVIHNYDASFLSGGGYTIENGDLVEKDYFAFVKQYEEENDPFTQTVFKTDKTTPLYTVVGEFEKAGRGPESRENRHAKGALVMDYNDCGKFNYDVYVERADGGDANEGDKADTKKYAYNSATSLFYTYLGTSDYTRDQSYAVFGMAKDFDGEMQPLLDAIAEYTESLGEDKTFTVTYEEYPGGRIYLNQLVQPGDDDFDDLRRSGIEASDYDIPLDMPIYVTSVSVEKY